MDDSTPNTAIGGLAPDEAVSDPAWHPGGWGGGDRREAVGGRRWISERWKHSQENGRRVGRRAWAARGRMDESRDASAGGRMVRRWRCTVSRYS